MAQATIQVEGAVGTIPLEAKVFKTGSKGFFGSGKMTTNNGKYQVSVNVVKIGSKPNKG